MRILLVAVPLMDRFQGRLIPIAMDRIRSNPPLGVYWLAALLRTHGYKVDVLDLIARGEIDPKALSLRAGRADLVGVSCNTLNWPTARVVIRMLKDEYPELPLVVGGIHPSGYPEHVLSSCDADFIIAGEGELPLVRLAEELEGRRRFATVPGLGWIENDSLQMVPGQPLSSSQELEELPDPAYDLLPEDIYESLSIESSRGCKFKCAFCSTKLRGTWRSISANQFVDRLERLAPFLQKTRYKVFSIVDDLYTLDIARVRNISAELARRKLKIQATLDARATDVIRDGVCEALVPITNHMLIGAECGYDEGLRKIRKGCTVAVLRRAAKMLQDAGLSNRCVFSFIIGFPFETADDCRRTIELASELLTRHNVRIYLQWYNTIPGSTIWSGLEAQGLLSIDMYDDFGFFRNADLFRAGVHLSLEEIRDLSNAVQSINTLLLLTQPADDVIQFSAPDWLFHTATLNFPSHGVLQDGTRPPVSPGGVSRGDVAGLVGLRS